LVKLVVILGVIKPYTCSYTRTLRFLHKMFFNFVWTELVFVAT